MSKNRSGILIPHKYIVLLALWFSALVCQIEMGAFRLFVQDIKTSLSLSDTELGLLTGFAYSATYAAVGIPLARRADRGSRVLVVAGCAALASIMMFLYGAVANFWQMVMVRMGVGVGEAGGGPASVALIASAFSREERPRALSLYGLALPIGGAIGLFVSGWAGQVYGWRRTFMALGVLGLCFSFLTWILLVGRSESRAGELSSTYREPVSSPSPGFLQAIGVLLKIRTYRNILLSTSVMAFFSAGVLTWITPYFIRNFHLSTGVLGTWFSIAGFAGMFGALMGGYIASRFASEDEALHLKVNAMLYAVSCALLMLILVSKSSQTALTLYVVNSFVLSLSSAPVISAFLTSVPQHVRSLSFAVIGFFSSIIGLGLGPLLVGSLSDLFRHWAGDQSLRYAILVLCPGYLWSSYHMWAASKTIANDVQKTVESDRNSGSQFLREDLTGPVEQIVAGPI